MEEDLAAVLEYTLSKLENCTIITKKLEFDISVLKDVSLQSSKEMILKNIRTLIQHSKAENSLVSQLVSVLKGSYSHARIYKEAKDDSFDEHEQDKRKLGNAQSWVSKYATQGKIFRLFNEAITNNEHCLEYCFTGSMKKMIQMGRQLQNIVKASPKNRSIVFQKIKNLYTKCRQ